jgi:MFS family permease
MSSPVATPSGREVLSNPAVRALLISSTTITVGVMLQAAALGKHVFDITHSELSIGWLGLAEFLPAALLVLVTGTVADHFNRKIITMLGMSGELLCALLFVWFARSNPHTATPVYLIAFLFGTVRAFIAPAMRSIPPMIAPPGGLPRLIALYSATWTGAAIVGPAVSGFLYAISPAVAYATAAVLIAVGLATFSTIRLPEVPEPIVKPERPTLKSAMEGLHFIRETPVLLAAISLDLFAVLFGGAVALLPAIASDQLHVGPVAYGWLRAAGGIGAAVMAVFLSVRPVRRKVGRVLLTVVAIFGVATIVLGTTHIYAVAFAALLIAFAADMVSVFIRGSLVPLVTPDDKRGRVNAVENVFIGASNELGAFESGAIGNWLGTTTTVVGGGVATMLIVGIWWVAFPALRDVDTFEELEQGNADKGH